jgi:hypothetical protein
MKKNIFKNWKTTLFGVSALLGGITSILKGDINTGIIAISGAFGLFHAKDHNN